jgi:peptidoglycan hydrolase-like protein with peptidoglycan-binding domain
MQHLLDQLGYMPWYYRDGKYDQTTVDAVSRFQADNPGTAAADGNGVYGAATNAALLNATGQ